MPSTLDSSVERRLIGSTEPVARLTAAAAGSEAGWTVEPDHGVSVEQGQCDGGIE